MYKFQTVTMIRICDLVSHLHSKVGWLVLNGTFSTKRLYCAMRKLKVWLQILTSDRKLKYVV